MSSAPAQVPDRALENDRKRRTASWEHEELITDHLKLLSKLESFREERFKGWSNNKSERLKEKGGGYDADSMIL